MHARIAPVVAVARRLPRGCRRIASWLPLVLPCGLSHIDVGRHDLNSKTSALNRAIGKARVSKVGEKGVGATATT